MAQEAAAETGPLHEYVIASRLRRNRTFYRALLLARVALFILFLAYRVYTILRTCSNVVGELESYRFNGGLGVVALVCEACFFVIFMLSIALKWFIVERVTYPDKLLERFGELPTVDVFVTTADPSKEPPLITMNTVLSVLTLDYPANKLACYVSDDGGSLLTLWALKETFAFAKANWQPFCTKFSPHIQPRAPGPYFSRHLNVDKATKYGFSNEWHAIKEKYQALGAKISSMTVAYCKSRDETLKILLNELKGPSISADYAQTVYSSWGLNYDPRNHSSYCEILSNKPPHDMTFDLPYLVYISREKRPQKKHNFKAGAMNTLLRVSGIMTNAPFVLNLDCDMYVNESNSLLQAMCIFMDKNREEANGNIGFVQFPQCFEGVDEDDIYGSSMAATMEIFLKGMDGAQGPAYCGTGCVHKRESLYGKLAYSTPRLLQTSNGKTLGDLFGRSSNFIFNAQDILTGTKSSTHLWNKDGLVMESIDLINSDYEEKTSWGEEVGWVYGSTTEDLLTGMKIHGRGWKSVFCMPYPPAFLGCAPSTIEDALTTRKRWSMGMLEILFSSNSPLLVKSMQGLSNVQRFIYIYIYGYILTCFPFFTYLLLPALSIIAGRQPVFPKVVDPALLFPMSLVFCMYMSNIFENKVVGIGLKRWWNSERMEYIVAISSTIFAVYEVLKKKVLGLSEITFTITPKEQKVKFINQNEYSIEENDNPQDSHQGFVVNSTLPIFVPPTVVVIINIVGLIVAFVRVIRSPLSLSLWPSTEVACSLWILFMLHPFTKGFLLWSAGQSGPFVLSTSSVLHASLLVIASAFIVLYL